MSDIPENEVKSEPNSETSVTDETTKEAFD